MSIYVLTKTTYCTEESLEHYISSVEIIKCFTTMVDANYDYQWLKHIQPKDESLYIKYEIVSVDLQS